VTAAYAGDWTLTRTIADLDADALLACTGSATLRDTAGELRYDERVAYRLGEKTIRATRSYRFRSNGPAIVAAFADGAPFFELELSAAGTGWATHACGADAYALTLTLAEPNAWETCWDVTGTKRLRIATRYVRST
jgi:hypothetical protein